MQDFLSSAVPSAFRLPADQQTRQRRCRQRRRRNPKHAIRRRAHKQQIAKQQHQQIPCRTRQRRKKPSLRKAPCRDQAPCKCSQRVGAQARSRNAPLPDHTAQHQRRRDCRQHKQEAQICRASNRKLRRNASRPFFPCHTLPSFLLQRMSIPRLLCPACTACGFVYHNHNPQVMRRNLFTLYTTFSTAVSPPDCNIFFDYFQIIVHLKNEALYFIKVQKELT